ncbi:MAG TPA: hypothetical protein VND20_07700 [Candidatus Binataceae bacterium]|nr:hypothetical protein [Candidatus Binataceae bacterium]
MRNKFLAIAAAAAMILICGCGPKAPPATASAPTTPASAASGGSGVYGMSGARLAGGAPEGVVGECVWIYDADDRRQVAKGECVEPHAGQFRIALKPGHYMLHGPGGVKPIEIPPGGWIKVTSLVDLPMSP